MVVTGFERGVGLKKPRWPLLAFDDDGDHHHDDYDDQDYEGDGAEEWLWQVVKGGWVEKAKKALECWNLRWTNQTKAGRKIYLWKGILLEMWWKYDDDENKRINIEINRWLCWKPIVMTMMIRRPWKTERRSTKECGWYSPAWVVSPSDTIIVVSVLV